MASKRQLWVCAPAPPSEERVRPGALAFVLLLVGAATYFEFVYYGPASAYAVALWTLAVPMLFAATVESVRDRPLYRPSMYAGLVAIGVLQYLDGNWFLLAGLFVLAGVAGLRSELRTGELARSGSR